MSIDPRSRMRVETVSVRPSVRRDLTNEELLTLFLRSLDGGKVAGTTRARFTNQIREAIRYFRHPDGAEIPAREWTSEAMWGYVHFTESSLCANFVQLSFRAPVLAKCKAGAWEGTRDAEEAAVGTCATCPLFKRQAEGARKRLGSLNRFFGFLASVGAVPFNFVRDVVEQHGTQNKRRRGGPEKKRNPSPAEMVRLVNETAHVRRRGFYACSAKWGARPNEMLALDRFLSFGEKLPEGMATPPGFENGFPKHPHLKPFSEGGQLVYIPEKRDAQGNPLPDKRTGNRWLVVDMELRPLVEQVLADWDRSVKRDGAGLPVGSGLWLNGQNRPEQNDLGLGCAPSELSARWFYPEAERLGLMMAGDRADPRRAWTAHSQRHFFEKMGQTAKVPGDWQNRFRGDSLGDERDGYFEAKPEEVLAVYLDHIPRLGFKPLPDRPRLVGKAVRGEAEMHKQIVTAEAARVAGRKRGEGNAELACVTVEGMEAPWVVPARIAGSCLFAARKVYGQGVSLGPKARRRVDVAAVCERTLRMLA